MPSKKKSKGVLERIGDAASSAAEVVINAGSKAMHAVGDMMPAQHTQSRESFFQSREGQEFETCPEGDGAGFQNQEGCAEEENCCAFDQESSVEESSADSIREADTFDQTKAAGR